MKVTMLGTGTTINKRAGASLHVQTDRSIIFDIGPRSAWNMELAGIERNAADAIFISHGHADHYSDILLFFFDAVTSGRDESLDIYCPPGLGKPLGAIKSFPIIDKAEFTSSIREITNKKITLGSTDITAKEVVHDPAIHSNAYRIEHEGKSIVYSGDSIKCKELIEISKGADLVIFEAAHVKPHPKHMTPQEAGEAAQEAGAKKLVLTHLYPDSDEADIVSMAKKKFSGDIIKAEDLMEIEI
ncbi:MAG: ribonuclease Z [Candidatus Aenigmarchaeota archaeon]|nr:ribonuclease Z [Candidatus Aenigmarchaeota archaeon]